MKNFVKSLIITYVLFFQVVYCEKPIPEILTKKNFSWIFLEEIAGMEKPETKEQIQALHDLNIGLIVTLIEGVDPTIFDGVDIEHLTLQISDASPRVPTIEQVDEFIKRSKNVLKNKGKATVVHCQYGQGRTGTMLTCWLIANKNMTPEQAIIFVRSRRYGSATDADQVKFIGDYYKVLLERKLEKLKKLKSIPKQIKQWESREEKFLEEQKSSDAAYKSKARKAKEVGAEEEEGLGKFFERSATEAQETLEKQRQLKILRERLGNLKVSLVAFKGKLSGLQQKLLLLKGKLEKAKSDKSGKKVPAPTPEKKPEDKSGLSKFFSNIFGKKSSK